MQIFQCLEFREVMMGEVGERECRREKNTRNRIDLM